MTAYELRIHLHRAHDVRMVGADYGTLLAVHDVEHRAGTDHDHDDGPGSATWARECREFGCQDAGVARVAVLEYMVLAAVVLLAWLVYWAAR